MPTFGQIGDQAGSSSSSADRRVASAAVCPANGTVVSLTCRVRLSSAGTGTLRGIIYTDTGGFPDRLLAVTDDATFTNTTEAEVTADFTGGNVVDVSDGTTYWIGFHQKDPGTPNIVRSQGSTAGLQASETDVFDTGTNDPWGDTTLVSGPLDVYVTFSQRETHKVATNFTGVAKHATTFTDSTKLGTAHNSTQKTTARFVGI